MSQDSLMRNAHPTNVRSPAADPAARTGKRAYNALSSSSVGIELGLSVAIGLLVGYYLDKWLGTEPWLMLLWLTLGLVAGFRGVIRAVKRADRAAEEMDAATKLGKLGEGGGRGDA
jgi:ATP synthase protein I